jgi:hypothetical protein
VETPAAAGNTVFADLLKEQLTQERARKATIEARGLAVITTAGGIVTILFALSALATKAEATFVLVEPARSLLTIASVVFVLAVLVALGTNAPLGYDEVTTEGLNDMASRDWQDFDSAKSERMVARARADMIISGRNSSNIKAWFLIVAMILEVVAVIALAGAVATILLRASPGA